MANWSTKSARAHEKDEDMAKKRFDWSSSMARRAGSRHSRQSRGWWEEGERGIVVESYAETVTTRAGETGSQQLIQQIQGPAVEGQQHSRIGQRRTQRRVEQGQKAGGWKQRRTCNAAKGETAETEKREEEKHTR